MQPIELSQEQAYFRWAMDCAEFKIQSLSELADKVHDFNSVYEAEILRKNFSLRILSFKEALRLGIAFGRIDFLDGQIFRVGRTHVETADGTIAVLDWRAPQSAAFYRATAADDQGLLRRANYFLENGWLVDFSDEMFGSPDGTSSIGGIPDPLLAQLGRARTGRMRDIVATIQSEQDLIIREPSDKCLVVQGGPGTGKTAVALHRAAYLMFDDRQYFSRTGILIVGPNMMFLDYIAQVLPSLGEGAAVQMTLNSLMYDYPVSAEEQPNVALIKADVRMAKVLKNLLFQQVHAPEGGLEFKYETWPLIVSQQKVSEAIDLYLEAKGSWASRRSQFADSMMLEAFRLLPRHLSATTDFEDFAKALRSAGFSAQISRAWKNMTGPKLARRLLNNARALDEAAVEILSRDEIALILRPKVRKGELEKWTRYDLGLIDEANSLVGAPIEVFGHVIVDEAQDYTPMELRLIGRRSTNNSMTILGDLAQATALAGATEWHSVTVHLGAKDNSKVDELTIGYRLSGQILEFANKLLPSAAPNVTPAKSAREDGAAPKIVHTNQFDLVSIAVELAVELSEIHSLVAVIAPSSMTIGIAELIEERTQKAVIAGDHSMMGKIPVLTAVASKGLEFDYVVLVEPLDICEITEGGERALFVALTRAVQGLTILESKGMPKALDD
jgi:DNA helicase IV